MLDRCIENAEENIVDNLYDISLFHRKFSIDGKIYSLLLQVQLKSQVSDWRHIFVLCEEGHEYSLLIMAWSIERKTLIPISNQDLSDVIRAIKLIPFPDKYVKYQCIIDSLKEIDIVLCSDIQFVQLTDSIMAALTTKSHVPSKKNDTIELEMRTVRLIPETFVFGAFDGLTTYLYFELERKNVDSIKDWGILSPIEVYINNISYGAYYAQKSRVINEERISFLCQMKIAAVLGASVIGAMRIEGVNFYELSDFIVSSAGLYNSVAHPEGYHESQNWYTIVIPVTGLYIQSETGLGNVQFYTDQNDEIQRIIAFDQQFASYKSFALVHVNSEKLYTSFVQAKKQIEQAVDLLVNIIKDDSLFSIHSIGGQLSERDNRVFEQKVKLSSLIFIESPFLGARLSCSLAKFDKCADLVLDESFIRIKKELEKAELLLLKSNGTNDINITPLFNALKWLRRAWDTDDFDDKIIYSIIALEFIVSKETDVPMMDKSLRKKCKGAIRKIISAIDNPEVNKIDYSQKVCEKFDRAYTETPFMLKLRRLIDQLDIPISKPEMDLIITARKQRNDIIHGKDDSKLPCDDVYKLCECISKIAFYKLFSLEM